MTAAGLSASTRRVTSLHPVLVFSPLSPPRRVPLCQDHRLPPSPAFSFSYSCFSPRFVQYKGEDLRRQGEAAQ